jgi:hypothetical protein
MSDARGFTAGDLLVFQVESGFAMMRLLGVEPDGSVDTIWHLAVYRDMYLDVDAADLAASDTSKLQINLGHVALTNRAFDSTQVSKLGNVPLLDHELRDYQRWLADTARPIEDRSIRLILGLR